MSIRRWRNLAAFVAVALWVGLLGRPAEPRAQGRANPPARGPYGWQVMTEEEVVEYQQTLEGLSTPESRAAFRVEHREKMKARARDRGVALSGPSERGAGKPAGRRAQQARSGSGGGSGRRPVGWELMSEQEKSAYRDTLQSLETREERTAFREEHRAKMEARAEQEGVSLEPEAAPRRGPAKRQIYGQQFMTDEERVTFVETFRSLKTPEERQAFRQSHVAEMQRRAKEQGVELPAPKQAPGAARAAAPGPGPGD